MSWKFRILKEEMDEWAMLHGTCGNLFKKQNKTKGGKDSDF